MKKTFHITFFSYYITIFELITFSNNRNNFVDRPIYVIHSEWISSKLLYVISRTISSYVFKLGIIFDRFPYICGSKTISPYPRCNRILSVSHSEHVFKFEPSGRAAVGDRAKFAKWDVGTPP